MWWYTTCVTEGQYKYTVVHGVMPQAFVWFSLPDGSGDFCTCVPHGKNSGGVGTIVICKTFHTGMYMVI